MSDARLWDDLLLAIEERHVVPIIGHQLLSVDTPSGPRLFLELVAESLAAELGVDQSLLPPRFLPNDVVCAVPHFELKDIQRRVAHIVREMKVDIPAPLRLLAEIRNFGLFVSTSFDTLLEEAIAQVRGDKPAVASFPPTSKLNDFSESLLYGDTSMVFQILGRASITAQFAVTEGQMLEQMHLLLESAQRPKALIQRLRNSHLLIIGVGLPDWLSRFMVRLSRANPLWFPRDNMEYIVGGANPDQQFVAFMRHFSQLTIIVDSETPESFVKELHRRWFERNPGGSSPEPDATPRPLMAPGSIFVSYASEDRAAAFMLADELISEGLEVWIDRQVHPGDEYKRMIERNIRQCGAFIPVISRHTQTAKERWFRREWDVACDRQKGFFASGRSLLFPVVIDDTPYDELKLLQEEIFGRSAVHAPGGRPPSNLVESLNNAQQSYRIEVRA